MHRSRVSRPVAIAMSDGLIGPGRSFFDYGCGRGTDVAYLASIGTEASGWDPRHAPDQRLRRADVVNLGYVVNVIESPAEREEVLRKAWSLAQAALVVSARLDWDIAAHQATPLADGFVTARGTFQKFYSHDELRGWIETTLGTEAHAAAPGVFYVFRADDARETFLLRIAARSFRGAAGLPLALSEEDEAALIPLQEFLAERGRPPIQGELGGEGLLTERFGSLKRAVRLAARESDPSAWEQAALSRQRDLLVYLALGTFRKRPPLRMLPPNVQADIRAFFGTYSDGAKLGEELLRSTGQLTAIAEECANSSVGKMTPDALYVHVTAVSALPVLLRVYEGCARVLLGDVPGATLVKLRKDKPKISYLCYPDFDKVAHPSLETTYIADLRKLRTDLRSYTDRKNPPLLHRKETFVAKDYPGWEKFRKLTTAEDRAGLLQSATIGTKEGWESALAAAGMVVKGHRLLRVGHTI